MEDCLTCRLHPCQAMGFDNNSLYPGAAFLACLLRHQVDGVPRMNDLAVELLCMLLQDLESLRVGLLGNDNRAVGPHDAGFGFCNGFNAATCARQEWLSQVVADPLSDMA